MGDPTDREPQHDLIDTVRTPDPDADPGEKVKEIGEPFENNNA